MMSIKRDDIARFDAKHVKHMNGCWLWTGATVGLQTDSGGRIYDNA